MSSLYKGLSVHYASFAINPCTLDELLRLREIRCPGEISLQNTKVLLLEREVIRRFEFETYDDAESTIYRFVDFYNNKRLHTAIGYITPREMNEKWMKENQKA